MVRPCYFDATKISNGGHDFLTVRSFYSNVRLWVNRWLYSKYDNIYITLLNSLYTCL